MHLQMAHPEMVGCTDNDRHEQPTLETGPVKLDSGIGVVPVAFLLPVLVGGCRSWPVQGRRPSSCRLDAPLLDYASHAVPSDRWLQRRTGM